MTTTISTLARETGLNQDLIIEAATSCAAELGIPIEWTAARYDTQIPASVLPLLRSALDRAATDAGDLALTRYDASVEAP